MITQDQPRPLAFQARNVPGRLAEIRRHPGRAGFQAHDAKCHALRAQVRQSEQIGERLGQRPEAVFQFLGQRGGIGRMAEADVQRDPGGGVRHVIGLDIRGHVQRQVGAAVVHVFAALAGHRLAQQVAGEFHAEQFGVAGLRVTEEVSGAALVQVGGGHCEAGAQAVMCHQGGQATCGGRRGRACRVGEQEGHAAGARAADPPA